MLKQQALNDNFSNQIFYSDEAHITLDGYVHKQNCSVWGSENPQVIEKWPLHLEKVTVWCAHWSEGMIGLYIFENGDGMTLTVNSELYSHMITDFFLPAVEEYDLENMWFQLGSATCRATRANMVLLQEKLPGRVISRRAISTGYQDHVI